MQRTLRRLHLFISPGGLLTFDVRLPERLAALDGQVFLDETEDTYCVWRTEYRRGLQPVEVDRSSPERGRVLGPAAWSCTASGAIPWSS